MTFSRTDIVGERCHQFTECGTEMQVLLLLSEMYLTIHAGKSTFLNKETSTVPGATRSPVSVLIICLTLRKDLLLRKLSNGQSVSNICFLKKESMLQEEDFPKRNHKRLQHKPRYNPVKDIQLSLFYSFSIIIHFPTAAV